MIYKLGALQSLLTVHSWVSRGHVGHGSAEFVLMRMGIEATKLPCVVFSNSKSLGVSAGGPLDAAMVEDLARGITEQPYFLDHWGMWSGFMWSPEVAHVAIKMFETLKDRLKAEGLPYHLPYICDPVLGDGGKFYVRKDLVETYHDFLMPRATFSSPNRYEAGWILGKDAPRDYEEAQLYAKQILERYPSLEAVTITGVIDGDDKERLYIVLRTREGETKGWSVKHYYDRHFAGTGDLFTGITTGYLMRGATYVQAVEEALVRVAIIIQATHEAGTYDLRIVQHQDVLLKNDVERDRYILDE